jgi:hypothetical protein
MFISQLRNIPTVFNYYTNPIKKLRQLRGYVYFSKYIRVILAEIYYPVGYSFPLKITWN